LRFYGCGNACDIKVNLLGIAWANLGFSQLADVLLKLLLVPVEFVNLGIANSREAGYN
jgi:hypothetical protein